MNETETEKERSQAGLTRSHDRMLELIAAQNRIIEEAQGVLAAVTREPWEPIKLIREQADYLAQQAMFGDIDAILSRVETGIAAERKAMDALLERLSGKAAA